MDPIRHSPEASMREPGRLEPHPERVTDTYADERIGEKIGMYAQRKPREGLERVSARLKEAGVPAAYRLHYISAIAHLGKVGEDTLPNRLDRSGRASD